MEQETIIIVSVFAAGWAVVFLMAVVALVRLSSLRRTVQEMQHTGRIRVQKLKMNGDKNHAFQNPALSPDEELSRRGYSMYMGDDVESGRGTTERQTGGQFVEELTREIDHRQQRKSSPAFEEFNMERRGFDNRGVDNRAYDNSRPRDNQPYDNNRAIDNRAYDNPNSRPIDNRPYDNNRGIDSRSIDRNDRSNAPPFLLQAIEENKRKSRLNNPVANGGRQSDTNPNFIY